MSKGHFVEGIFARWIKSDPNQHDKALPMGWFAIRSDWIPEEHRPKRRGNWYKISNGKHSCFRALRMDPTLEGSLKNGTGQINIDWDGWLALHGNTSPDGKPVQLTMRPATKWESLFAGHGHPDPGVRTAAHAASASIFLGFVALMIAISQYFI